MSGAPEQSLNRRQWLRAVAGASAATACYAAAPAPAVVEDTDSVIDVHIHTNFQDSVLQKQAQRISGIDFTPQGLLAEMAANHVQQALTIGFDSDGGELSHDAANPMGLKMYARYGSALRMVGLIGGINPYQLDQDGLEAIEQALRERQVRGLKIYLGYYHLHADDDRYKPVYELAGRYKVPVVLHTGDTYSANAKVRFAHPLRIDDIAVDFREVTLVLAHLGNPWTVDAGELLYKNPNVYGDLSGFLIGDAGYFHDPKNAAGIDDAVERITKAFRWVENPAKFLYGSDWPLAPMKPYLDFVRRAIPAEHHRAVLHDNARAVFRLA